MRRMKRRLGLAGVRVGEARHPGPPFKLYQEELQRGFDLSNQTLSECNRLFGKVQEKTNAPQKNRARGSR